MRIEIEIKEGRKATAETIDREIRMILRDHLETAVEDAINEVPGRYHYEGGFVAVDIVNE